MPERAAAGCRPARRGKRGWGEAVPGAGGGLPVSSAPRCPPAPRGRGARCGATGAAPAPAARGRRPGPPPAPPPAPPEPAARRRAGKPCLLACLLARPPAPQRPPAGRHPAPGTKRRPRPRPLAPAMAPGRGRGQQWRGRARARDVRPLQPAAPLQQEKFPRGARREPCATRKAPGEAGSDWQKGGCECACAWEPACGCQATRWGGRGPGPLKPAAGGKLCGGGVVNLHLGAREAASERS